MLQTIHKKAKGYQASPLYCHWILVDRPAGACLAAVWMDREMRGFEQQLAARNSRGVASGAASPGTEPGMAVSEEAEAEKQPPRRCCLRPVAQREECIDSAITLSIVYAKTSPWLMTCRRRTEGNMLQAVYAEERCAEACFLELA
jgi:hypothetical protein